MSVTSHTTQDVKEAKADVLQSVVSHVLPYQHIEVSEADADSKKKKSAVKGLLLLLVPGI